MAPDRVKEIIRDELKGGWAVEDGDVWTSVTNINFVVKELAEEQHSPQRRYHHAVRPAEVCRILRPSRAGGEASFADD